MKYLFLAVAAAAFLGTVVPADAQRCPPGTRYYCEGSKCRCV